MIITRLVSLYATFDKSVQSRRDFNRPYPADYNLITRIHFLSVTHGINCTDTYKILLFLLVFFAAAILFLAFLQRLFALAMSYYKFHDTRQRDNTRLLR